MKDVFWGDCIESHSAREVSPNIERANSLIEISEARLSIINEIKDKNCNFVFEDHYTSLLELLQALVIKNGYNVLNHLCLGYYLRDVLKREDLYRVFDDLRYKRNSLTYYVNLMDIDTAKEAIGKCEKIIVEIKLFLK